jgi:hypothetical protein
MAAGTKMARGACRAALDEMGTVCFAIIQLLCDASFRQMAAPKAKQEIAAKRVNFGVMNLLADQR